MLSLDKKSGCFLLLITAVAFFLRFYKLEQQSFWTDEVSSVNTARAPWNEITELSASLNNSLPVYFAILRPFAGATNDHIEFRARSLSALAGGITVPIFVWLLYLWRENLRVAITGGFLLAVNPLHLWYSQEVRAYAVMLMFGVLALVLFELSKRAEKVKLGLTIGYIFCALFATALHKTGMVFFVAVAVWQVWVLAGKRPPGKGTAPAVTGAPGKGTLPTGTGRADMVARIRWAALWPHAVVGLFIVSLFALKSFPPTREYGRPGSVLELGYTGMTYLGGYSFGPSLTEIQTVGPLAAIKRHPIQVPILIAIVLILAGLFIWKWQQTIRSREMLLIIIGVGLVVLASLFSAFPYNVRYTLPALIGFIALVALVIAEANPKLRCLLLAAVLGIEICGVCQWFRLPLYRKGDSRGVAHWLEQKKGTITSWTVLPDYLEASILFYLPSNSAVRAAMLAPTGPQSTTFPPVPDALILGRRHHLVAPDKVIEDYGREIGAAEKVYGIAGFEIYARSQGNPGSNP